LPEEDPEQEEGAGETRLRKGQQKGKVRRIPSMSLEDGAQEREIIGTTHLIIRYMRPSCNFTRMRHISRKEKRSANRRFSFFPTGGFLKVDKSTPEEGALIKRGPYREKRSSGICIRPWSISERHHRFDPVTTVIV